MIRGAQFFESSGFVFNYVSRRNFRVYLIVFRARLFVQRRFLGSKTFYNDIFFFFLTRRCFRGHYYDLTSSVPRCVSKIPRRKCYFNIFNGTVENETRCKINPRNEFALAARAFPQNGLSDEHFFFFFWRIFYQVNRCFRGGRSERTRFISVGVLLKSISNRKLTDKRNRRAVVYSRKYENIG